MKSALVMPMALFGFVPDAAAQSPAYDFNPATALLQSELPRMFGRAAVIVRQGGKDIFTFQSGSIGFDTRTRMASLTKTISAGVMLDLVEDGVLAMDERLGGAFPALFESRGIGDPTVLDCWAMRHGLESPIAYQHNRNYTHVESVVATARDAFEVFRPGEKLGYNGLCMQVASYIGVQRTGHPWEVLAQDRLFGPLGMNTSDFGQFTPNPGVAGGMRSSALDVMAYAEMVIDGGWTGPLRLLEAPSIERLFTNHTRGLPVHGTPFPASHPSYPYGVAPDYAFGSWVLAEDPVTEHVEEIVGAGAWGSFVWIDRRRGLTAVLITDVPAGSQRSLNAGLGLMAVARTAVEAEQASGLAGATMGNQVLLTWSMPAASRLDTVVGSHEPIRDIFDLRAADALGRSRTGRLLVERYPYYAVTSELRQVHNTALVPGRNAIRFP